MNSGVETIDYDTTLRLYNLDFRHKVRGIWDENIPIINHTVIEARGIDADFLDSTNDLKRVCDQFCLSVGLNVVERRIHDFTPIGKTVFYVLEESHLSMHTWPENGYIHLDLVTCMKDELTPLEIATIFENNFNPSHMRYMKLRY